MLLRIEDLEEIADPSPTDIAAALQRLGSRDVDEVTLEQRPGWFLRTGRSPNGCIWMLAADGMPRTHLETPSTGVSIGEVAAAFAAYRDGREDWSKGCRWQTIPEQTRWQVILNALPWLRIWFH